MGVFQKKRFDFSAPTGARKSFEHRILPGKVDVCAIAALPVSRAALWGQLLPVVSLLPIGAVSEILSRRRWLELRRNMAMIIYASCPEARITAAVAITSTYAATSPLSSLRWWCRHNGWRRHVWPKHARRGHVWWRRHANNSASGSTASPRIIVVVIMIQGVDNIAVNSLYVVLVLSPVRWRGHAISSTPRSATPPRIVVIRIQRVDEALLRPRFLHRISLPEP